MTWCHPWFQEFIITSPANDSYYHLWECLFRQLQSELIYELSQSSWFFPKSSSSPNKHIFVRAKRVCLLWEKCLLWVGTVGCFMDRTVRWIISSSLNMNHLEIFQIIKNSNFLCIFKCLNFSMNIFWPQNTVGWIFSIFVF